MEQRLSSLARAVNTYCRANHVRMFVCKGDCPATLMKHFVFQTGTQYSITVHNAHLSHWIVNLEERAVLYAEYVGGPIFAVEELTETKLKQHAPDATIIIECVLAEYLGYEGCASRPGPCASENCVAAQPCAITQCDTCEYKQEAEQHNL